MKLEQTHPPKVFVKFSRSEANAFWNLVSTGKHDECWEFDETRRGSDGYPHFSVRGNSYRAHRVAYFLHYKIDPGYLVVRHLCHNKRCCNPKHLATGTRRDNGHDNRGRWKNRIRTPLTPDQIRQVRALADECTRKDIASRFGVSVSHVTAIIYRRTCNHVD